MELWVNEFWLFITAVVFTFLGYYWGIKAQTINVIEATIDGLIAEGYLKVKPSADNSKEIEIYKWQELSDDQDPK